MISSSNVAKNEYFTGVKLALLTLAISLATFMEVLDSTIVNVSLPHIAGSLGATISQGTWTISAYTLASAIVVPLTGWLATRFGQVKTFIIAILLFSIMSFLCAVAKNIETLVVFRFLQGFFSGPMVPLSQTLLVTNYPPEKRGLAFAFFVMTIILAPIFGPILGGYLTDTFSWPWLFYINVPIGLLAALVCFILLRNKETSTIKVPIDYIGLILLILGVGSLQLVLDNGNDKEWFSSTFIIVLSIIAFVGIVLLIIWELTDEHPVVDLGLFKNRNFFLGLTVMFLGMFCFFGSTIIFPLWVQTVKGYTSYWAGLATAPIGILPFFLAPVIGIFLPKLNLRLIVTLSFIIFACTMLWFSTFTKDISFGQLIIPRFIQGIGVACFFLPLNQITLSDIPPEKLVSATSLFNFFRAISTSFASAIVIFTWQHYATKEHAILTESVNSGSSSTNNYLSILDSLHVTGNKAYFYISNIIDTQAFTMSTQFIFRTMAFTFIGLIALVWLTKSKKLN